MSMALILITGLTVTLVLGCSYILWINIESALSGSDEYTDYGPTRNFDYNEGQLERIVAVVLIVALLPAFILVDPLNLFNKERKGDR